MRKTFCALVTAFVLASPVAARSTGVKVLHDFGGSGDGTEPNGSLALDREGNLYGVTFGGPGEHGNGVAYELSPQPEGTWSETILHSFAGGSDGAIPQGGLALSRTGNLYGSLQGETSYAVGGVFELSNGSSGWSSTVVYADGAGPGLLMGRTGSLYGRIGPGDYFGLGAIGELSPESAAWNYTQLYSFTCEPQLRRRLRPTDPAHLGRQRQYVGHDVSRWHRPACLR